MSVRKQIKRLGKDTLFYGLGRSVQKFIGFFLFPIYTRILTQEDFGTQDLVLTAITIMSYFLILGLDSATARHYYDAETEEEKRSILSTWLWFEILISIPVVFLLILYAEPICELIFTDSQLAPYFRLGVAILPFSLISSVSLLTLRLKFQSKRFSIVTVSSVLVQALASIALVVYYRLGITGVFLASLITNIYLAIIGMVFTYRNFQLVLKISWLKPLLMFGVPLVPASISLWVMNYSNRYFLIRFTSLSDIGIYSVGARVASIVILIITAFKTAWGPFAYSLLKDQKIAERTYSSALTYFLLITMVGTVGLSIFGRELIVILATPAYEQSAFLVPWLCYAAIAWGCVYIVGIGYGIAKKSYHTTISTLLAALVTIGLNFLLISTWGIIGAAISTMIGNITALVYSYFLGQHYFTVQYDYRRVFSLVLLASVTIAAGLYIDLTLSTWSIENLIYKLLLFSAFCLSLFLLKIIRRYEINVIRGFMITKLRGIVTN